MSQQDRVIVIASVGTGRNREDIARAIVYSLEEHRADHAVFLCSAKTCQETLPEIRKRLGWPDDRVKVHTCADEDDVQRLFIEWNEQWDRWPAVHPPARVIVDFTSGTKPMSAAAVMLAVSREAHCLSYVVGERDETGRVTQSTAVRTIAPDLIVAHRQLRLAVEHFHAGNFAAARSIAEPYCREGTLPVEGLRKIALSIHYVATAYEAWDRFDYRQAAASLRDSERYWKTWTWLDGQARLADNRTLIVKARESCQSGRFGPALAADLLANADRCAQREDWDDAVARLYRLCEMLAQMRLLEKFDISTGDVDPQKLPGNLGRACAERKEKAAGGKLKLGLYDAFALLAELDDPLGREFDGRYGTFEKPGPLQGLLNARNQSLLAHGTVPIGGDKADQLRRHVEALARTADASILDEWLPKATAVRFGPF